ncbi:MAG: PPC domain-containing DNA-binding protein [Thermoplasmata archaeon]
MISDIEKNYIVVKIEGGEDVLESMLQLLDDYGIFSGLVIFGIGMIRQLEVGYWNGKEYVKEVLQSPGEVVSFHGSITSNEPRLHIHVAVAMPDHVVKGGHFFSGVADPLLEVHVVRLEEMVLKRDLNSKSGLRELTFE